VCAKLGLKPTKFAPASAIRRSRIAPGPKWIKDRPRSVRSPYIIVDGEPFWGSDRLDQIDKWLATGGW